VGLIEAIESIHENASTVEEVIGIQQGDKKACLIDGNF
jgi:hypothetical protein